MKQCVEVAGKRELLRLVVKGRTDGKPDAFLGPSQWIRNRLGLRLEATTADGVAVGNVE